MWLWQTCDRLMCPFRLVACLMDVFLCIHNCPRVCLSANKVHCFVFRRSCVGAAKRYFGYWNWHSSVFYSFMFSFLLFFLFSSQRTTCRVHPNWPAALHIGFLVFLANRLGCASKGIIYALKWMKGKPYLSSFQIWMFRAVTASLFLPDAFNWF